ncbi:MAG: MFS transporter [Spirochaetia bacterium]|nr:MFS transporter [Spirochaetia bacterium]
MNRFTSIFRVFSHRNYRIFFTGQGISFFGTMMQNTAQGWLVYRMTNSSAMLGLVAFAGQIPAFFMAPLAGILSDRLDKRKILLAADTLQMAQAIVMAILVISGSILPWHIVALAAVLGIANGFEMTTRHAMVPDVVGNKKDVGNAIALNSGMFNIGRILGPSVAGFVVAYYGEGMCFAINAATYIAIIYALLAMKFPERPAAGKQAAPFDDLKEGFKYTFSFKPLRDIILLMAFVSMTGSAALVLMPVYARDILHGGPQTLGTLMGAVGAGAILGAFYLASRKKIPGLGRVICVALLIFGAGLCGVAFVNSTWAAALLLVAAGAGTMLHMSSSNTIIQTVADDHMRGRALSFYVMSFSGFGPPGNLLAGYAAKLLGARQTVFALGMLTIAGAVVFAANLSSMGELLKPVYIRRGILPPDTGVE